MDPVHKERIKNNYPLLVANTSYERLIHILDKLDEKREILTDSLVLKWQDRSRLGWTSKQLCNEFYQEIQRRGPTAFELLINGLKDSGHLEIACALDPTLSIAEEPTEVVLYEYYENEGKHFVFLNEDWRNSDKCNRDREEVKNFFFNQGYLKYEEEKVKLEDVTSLVVIVFSQYHDGSQQMENDWLHTKFNDRNLSKKPKILISFLYTSDVKKYGTVEEESSRRNSTRNYEDVLHVKIYVDATKRGPFEVVSEEVQHFISVFSSNPSMHLEEKLLKLQQVYNEKGLHPITTLDSRFRKLYRVQKQT